MNIGSIHHNALHGRNAGNSAERSIPGKNAATERVSFEKNATQDAEQLQPIDRIPAIRNNPDAQHQKELVYPVSSQSIEQTSDRVYAGNPLSDGERAVAFYVITESISSAAISQGELIGIDTYA